MPRAQDHRLTFLQLNISRAKNRGDKSWDCSLTKEQAFRIGEKQGWRCALTGDKLEFTRGGQIFNNKWANPKSCTLDRIDPDKGYHAKNVQLVTWEANLLKSGFTMRQLRGICKKISKTAA